MKLSTYKKLGLAAVAAVTLAIVGSSAAQACVGTCSAVYRTYYLDRSCHYYYIDANGYAVRGGMYSSSQFAGLQLHKDCCSNRWFYMDAFGNKKYVSRRCA